ncbi:MAG: thiol peroxidase [Cyclobacteriaceae bacterium]
MAQVTLKGTPVKLSGEIPQVNSKGEDFTFVKDDMSEVKLSDIKDKIKILIAVPSLDTSVCAAETKLFSEKIADRNNVEAIVISKDLPFAMKRYMTNNNIENITAASDFRFGEFLKKYNVEMTEGPFKGLSARAVFVLDKDNTIKYAELVPEIAHEPEYDKVFKAIDDIS